MCDSNGKDFWRSYTAVKFIVLRDLNAIWGWDSNLEKNDCKCHLGPLQKGFFTCILKSMFIAQKFILALRIWQRKRGKKFNGESCKKSRKKNEKRNSFFPPRKSFDAMKQFVECYFVSRAVPEFRE